MPTKLVSGRPDPKPVRSARSEDRASPTERRDFKLAVLALDGRCLVHDDLGDCRGPLQAHHCLSQQHLRKHGLADELWNPVNGMTACEGGHAAHTSAAQRIERARLPRRCVDFAESRGLGYLLDRFYV